MHYEQRMLAYQLEATHLFSWRSKEVLPIRLEISIYFGYVDNIYIILRSTRCHVKNYNTFYEISALQSWTVSTRINIGVEK